MCSPSERSEAKDKNDQVVGSVAAGPSGRDLGVWESSLEDRANIFSLWSMSYLTPLLRLGSVKVMEADDIGVPSAQDEADRAYESINVQWDAEVASAEALNEPLKKAYEEELAACATEEEREKVKKPKYVEASMAKALKKGFGTCKVWSAILMYVVSALLQFVPVLILNDLVKFFQTGGDLDNYDTVIHPWGEVVALGVLPFLISLLQTRSQAIFAHCAVYARTAVSTLLYKKSLTASAAGRAQTSTGQVVNMMSNDTTQLQRFLQFAGMILVAPLQIFISLFLIYQQVGHALWVGVGLMFSLLPLNTFIFGIVGKMRRKVLKYSDTRVKMMNEILSGIRIIKFYAWEKPFGKEVSKIREKEMEALTQLAYVSAVGFSLIMLSVPIIQPILVFLTYVSISSTALDPATAFTTVALFNIMRFPFAFLPMGALQYVQSKISLGRLERYLQLPDLAEYVEQTPPLDAKSDSDSAQVASITIQDGSFAWVDPDGEVITPIQEKKKKKPFRAERRKSRRESRKNSAASTSAGEEVDSKMEDSRHSYVSVSDTESSVANPIVLQNISCTIEKGNLVAVVGSVGSGKSSLLSAILGEMEPIDGSKVYMPRDEANKNKAGFVSYCSQTPWVVNDTLRGNILFGRDFDQERYDEVVAKCALLDDLAVLPAGDMTEIGERGINLSGGQKARVSLARALYSKDTRVLLMDDPLSAVDAHVGEHLFSQAIAGPIASDRTRVLVTHHVHFLPRCDSVIIMEDGRIKHQGKYQDLIDQGVDFAGAVDVSKVTDTNDKDDEDGADKDVADDSAKEEKTDGAEAMKKAVQKEKGEKLITKEEREEGSVDGSAYIKYARAGGMVYVVLSLLMQGMGRGFDIVSSFWLSKWAEDAFGRQMVEDELSTSETTYYVGMYALWGILGISGLTLRAVIMALHRLNASKSMHNNLTDSILRAPVAFFDVTPVGRILNRFAADMDKIDLELTQSLGQGFSTIFSVLGALGAISAATKGTFLVALVPLSYIYYLIQKWFRKTSTELQRVNSIANSPIFSDFSQILSGTSTVRAYGEEERFFNKCKASFDTQNASYVLVQLANYWLGLRLDVLGGLIGAFVAGMAVATASAEFIPAGWLGLALSYSIEVTGFLKHGVRMIANIEAQMNSVERVFYYTEKIDAESAERVPEKDPAPGTWPSEGKIDISHASMRYRDGPLVLKDLSLTINPGEKVGVVGRTGSGKSSLMVSLFRISELENDGGKFLIDGVDIGQIGTEVLRSNLSIIPQDPVMWSNSVRYNLDPFEKASDAELWGVLKKVQLAEVIALLPGGLEEKVAEGGENFSQGQRQLLCIARSLLRKPKILIMDEATASIDNTTDAAIQDMIRENFADATVLTIAHRLNTIMDSDRVLVLDDGRIAEFDTPAALLQKEGGHFKTMVERSRSAHEKGAEEQNN
mmetsp:Transcript_25114/g.35376  ORF Transcript_25114/g.35376 Transcript_25114/m.35376 type:complete len:1428 (+) Transcript_25114:125-4408(+)